MRVLATLAFAVLVIAGCTDDPATGTGSSDDNLSNLVISSGGLTPAFSSTVMAYTVTVPSTTTQVTIQATTSSNKATLRVNNAIVASGQASPAVGLDVGTNLISVSVVAENGTNKVYSITVTR